MRFCLNTDCLGYMPFEEMLDTVAGLGYESIEIACGNWSQAPHIDLDAMLASEENRKYFMDAIAKRGLVLEVLNCSGNQLAPNEEGRQHQEVVEKTFKLAGLLGVKKIVMMSGCPGGSPTDTTPNWIVTSWPPITTKILDWQWEEVLIPYWKKTVKLAEENGIEKIALENHGCQMVYNPETLIRLRDAVGPMVGMNFDPSHLMWMGGDPITAIKKLGADRIYDTDAIASCVIGGASFMGGKGTMLGTMVGALVIATLRNGFTLLAISSAVQNMVLGLVIIAAVLLDVYRESMAASARRKEAAAKARA